MAKYSGLRRVQGMLSLLVLCTPLLTPPPALGQGTWTTKAPMLRPGGGPVAGLDGILYSVGGASGCCASIDVVQAYDPKTDTWTYKAPVPTARYSAAVGAIGGILYVAGGEYQDAFGPKRLDSVVAYDPKTNQWSSRAHMPTPRSGAQGAVLNGLLYVVGGSEPSVGVTDKVEAYDPQTDSWMSKAPLPATCLGETIAPAGGMLYAFGGYCHDNSGVVSLVAAYDPKLNTWTMKAPMPTARAGRAGVIEDVIYVVGGFTPGTYVNTVDAYDPATDSWSTATPMPTARFCAVGVVDDVLYAVGGAGPERTIFNRNEAFSPFLQVGIDIKPGEARNTINLKSQGVVAVAILGSATFDPLTVDPATVTLAGAPVVRRGADGRGVPMTSQGDFNRDGYLDLLLRFRTQDLKLAPGATEAVLYGTTLSGQRIRGADSVCIIRFAPTANSNPRAPLDRRRNPASRPN